MRGAILLSALLLLPSAAFAAIGQAPCVSFTSGFPVVVNGQAAPIITDSSDSPSVFRVVEDFITDINRVTGVTPKAYNYTSSYSGSTAPIIVGILGTPLIDKVVNATNLDVSALNGSWEVFTSLEVSNPLPGISKAYLVVGSDRRAVIYNLYELSEGFGVSPWYWWADVPIVKHDNLYALSCSHGPPTVKYRGIFLNDEQPALQNWAQEKFTNGTTPPFNHFFYQHLFELLLRLRVNYLWPAQWAGMFGVDDPINQWTANYYGVVMGTSHQEPFMRSTPNEFNKFYPGQAWDWYVNKANITQYFTEGAERAKPYESLFTVGMRGSGDEPLTASTNIPLLQDIIATQRTIIEDVFNTTDPTIVPQMWCLYKEVQGYYEEGMTVPDDITLLWVDDNWGNIRRFPLVNETSRAGGAGVYYHVDYVGTPEDFKWITSTQLSKVYEQMSMASERGANQIWVLNVGDLKPYEMSIEYFITLGWQIDIWNQNNVDWFVEEWAKREFQVDNATATEISHIVANVTRFNSRRKPELWNSTTYSLVSYREAEEVILAWDYTYNASSKIYNSLSADYRVAFFELVHHAVSASSNLAKMYVTIGLTNLYAREARISTNDLAEKAIEFFDNDYSFELEYHSMLDGKWDHMMDQTHIGYYYWQQPMTNSMQGVQRVHKNKTALAGPIRITPEDFQATWPGDMPNQCAAGYNCAPPTLAPFDPYMPIPSRYIEVSNGGPGSFDWTVNVTGDFIKVTKLEDTITRANPEDRVEVSIDWSKVNGSSAAGSLLFNANNPPIPTTVTVYVTANKTEAPSGFHGFVEGDGAVSILASHSTSNTSVDGISWTTLPGYGKTKDAIKPLPVMGNGGNNYTVGAGPSVFYDFYTFNNITQVTTYLGVQLNSYGDDRPLKYAIALDDETPQAIQYIPDATPGNLPAAWDTPDGWVANNIVTYTTNHTSTSPGAHTLKIWMIEPAVVIEKYVINTGNVRPSYLGPPESLEV